MAIMGMSPINDKQELMKSKTPTAAKLSRACFLWISAALGILVASESPAAAHWLTFLSATADGSCSLSYFTSRCKQLFFLSLQLSAVAHFAPNTRTPAAIGILFFSCGEVLDSFRE